MKLKLLVLKAIGKMSAMKTTMQFSILNLPNELIVCIVELIDDITMLRRLACSCRRIQQLTEPVLWRKLLIRQSAGVQRTLRAYERRRERATALQVLSVPCKSDFGHDMTGLASLMMCTRNLKELMVESPSCNLNDFETDEQWQPMMDQFFLPFQRSAGLSTSQPLQNLQHLTLHLNGPRSPYWTPDHRSISIFLHPTLKYLKISCVSFPADVFNEIRERDTTPLQHLVLEECNITHEGLSGLLALPKQLQHLFLGENCHNERQFENEVAIDYNHLFRRNASATVLALSQQKTSLQSLTYAAAGIVSYSTGMLQRMLQPRLAGIDAGFTRFDALESVALIGSCSAFERAVMSSASPPNLRCLSYQGENPITSPQGSSRHAFSDEAARNSHLVSLLPFLRAPSASVPAGLESLDVIYQRNTSQPVILSDEKQTHIHRTAKALKGIHGAALMVKFKGFGRYFPPFLYKEPEPKEKLIYDGEKEEFGPTVVQVDDDSDEEWMPHYTR